MHMCSIHIFCLREAACMPPGSYITLYANIQPRARDERWRKITSDIVQVSVHRHLTSLSYHFSFIKCCDGARGVLTSHKAIGPPLFQEEGVLSRQQDEARRKSAVPYSRQSLILPTVPYSLTHSLKQGHHSCSGRIMSGVGERNNPQCCACCGC